MYAEMFGVGVRYSGASWPVAMLAVVLGLVSAVSTLFLRETRDADTTEREAIRSTWARA